MIATNLTSICWRVYKEKVVKNVVSYINLFIHDIGCNIWMICLELNSLFLNLYGHLHYSAWVVSNNLLLIDATYIEVRLRAIIFHRKPLSFFANTPFKRVAFAIISVKILDQICRIIMKQAILNLLFYSEVLFNPGFIVNDKDC